MCILDAHLHHPGSKSTREKNTSNSKDVKGGRKLELGTWKVGGGGWGEKHQMRISAKGKGEGMFLIYEVTI